MDAGGQSTPYIGMLLTYCCCCCFRSGEQASKEARFAAVGYPGRWQPLRGNPGREFVYRCVCLPVYLPACQFLSVCLIACVCRCFSVCLYGCRRRANATLEQVVEEIFDPWAAKKMGLHSKGQVCIRAYICAMSCAFVCLSCVCLSVCLYVRM